VSDPTESEAKLLKATQRNLRYWWQKQRYDDGKHRAQFEKTKYILIYFMRNQKTKTDVAICIEGMSIPPSKEAKYLGVVFDQELRFRSHVNQAVKKGTQFRLAIGSIARATWGTPFKYLRRLFTSVTAPWINYIASIWHHPEDIFSATPQEQTKFLIVQPQIMKTMMGCFHTTSTDSLQNETGLLPPRLHLCEKVLKSVTRMLTLPPQHPLH
jgi:hypothetical protein